MMTKKMIMMSLRLNDKERVDALDDMKLIFGQAEFREI